jgi:uncharacterized protein
MGAKLDIRKLKPGKSKHEFELDYDDLDLDSSDIMEVNEAGLSVEVDSKIDELYVTGKATFSGRLECARCLEPFDLEQVYDLAFVVKIFKAGQLSGLESESSDDYFVIDTSVEEFDFAPLVREKILLSIPMKPLCGEDCRGLCPRCGTNLNIEDCDCADEITDDRFSALAKLNEDNEGEQYGSP